VPNAAHQAGVRCCCALLAVDHRLICLERQRLAERARGAPDSIRGADCVALCPREQAATAVATRARLWAARRFMART
jgi:hypothetical protein